MLFGFLFPALTDSGKKQPFLPRNPSSLKQNKSQVILKIAAGFIGVLALLFILIISVDLNTFREPVTEALSRATGLKIKLEFLDWGFSGGLKIKREDVQIFSGETEEELVSTKELLVSLSWLPLLEKRVVINSLTLVGPVLKVAIKPSSKNVTLPSLEKSGSGNTSSPFLPKATESSSSNGLHDLREFLKNPNFSLTVINTEARMRIRRDESRVKVVLDEIKLGTGNLLAQGEIRADDFLLQDSF